MTCEVDEDGNFAELSLADSLAKSRIADPLSLLKMLTPSDDPQAAGRIGPFEITGIVGSGGMGLVLKARDPALDRFVAIKILAPHLAASKTARKRFAREACAAAAVIHDNVIAIYQVAEWNELPYLVMPYLPDPSLQQRIDDCGRLDLEATLSIGMQVAKGLAAAHSQGLVHRDVKPANVLLAKGTERAIITDFGLARAADDASLTRIGWLAGTPHYMSPEQARGEPVDQRSDLFSLGSLLFAMLAGRPPVTNEFGSETIQQIASGKVPSLSSVSTDAPEWLVKLVDWLHQAKPADRPQSAAQVAEWLEQCLAFVRQPTGQSLPAALLQTPKIKPNGIAIRRWLPVALAISLLALVYPILLIRESLVNSQLTNQAADTLADSSAEISGIDHSLRKLPEKDSKPTFDAATDSTRTTHFDWLGDESEIEAITRESQKIQASVNDLWQIQPKPQVSTTDFQPESPKSNEGL